MGNFFNFFYFASSSSLSICFLQIPYIHLLTRLCLELGAGGREERGPISLTSLAVTYERCLKVTLSLQIPPTTVEDVGSALICTSLSPPNASPPADSLLPQASFCQGVFLPTGDLGQDLKYLCVLCLSVFFFFSRKHCT